MRSIIAKNIIETIPIGLLVVSPDGEISLLNEATCSILGYSQETFHNKGVAELFFEEEHNYEFNEFIVEVIREEKYNLQRTVPYFRPSGELLQLALTSSFIRDHENKPALVILLDDVTPLHTLHQREKAILQEKNRIQRERAESLNQLALAVAHQLRNPATTIGGFALLMLKKMGEESPFARHLHSILEDAGRLERMVKAVEEYARIPSAVIARVSLLKALQEAALMAEQATQRLERQIQWVTKLRPISVFIDLHLFKQALYECFMNAIEAATTEFCSIEISAASRDGVVAVEIEDNGRGISSIDRPFIFDPFFSTKADGVGMGLCKAQRIIFEHNGSLYINDRPGGGTIVTIEIPQSELDQNAGEQDRQ